MITQTFNIDALLPALNMVTYKPITLNLDKKFISDIENLMDSKIRTEKGAIIFEVHVGNKQDFFRRLLRAGYNQINLELEKQTETERKNYENRDSNNTESEKNTKR
jgi:hypothetical protein